MANLMFVTGSSSVGGAERHAVAVLNRLAERGHRCHAVCIKETGDLFDQVRQRNGATVRSLDAGHYLDIRAVADFAAHLARVDPSAIVAANGYALMYSWLARCLCRSRAALVVTYHSNRLLGAKENLQMMLYRLFFWTADCSVFVCRRQRGYWRRRGVFSRRNEVIYNGVDTEAFRDTWSVQGRRALRRALGFSDADYVIGLSALLRPEKNPVQLVDAIAALRVSAIPARALIIGDGEMRGAIQARARSLDVADSVVVTGLKRDVRPYVVACDAMALCSLTEALSLSAIESMALGRPVVHSNVGGAAELIVPGRNGFLFPVGDTRAFVDKLAILADPAVSTMMGREARATAEALFSERIMVDRYERLLLAICGPGATVHPEHADRIKATH
ncbi:MAG TPA: glycosyltransferase [Burkholderiales bacterium]|nr:glycosyltransferase [Burkholderiales bacterium]